MAAHPNRDERLAAVQCALDAAGLDALVVTHSPNVLLLTGFWPVAGASVAVVTRGGTLTLLAPGDAQDLAARGWADALHTYAPGSLAEVHAPGAVLARELARRLPDWLAGCARVGVDAPVAHLPATYVAQQVLAALVAEQLREALPAARLEPAGGLLAELRSQPTAWERTRIRTACRIAQAAFEQGSAALRPGVPEAAAVLPFQHALTRAALAEPDVERSGGSFFCMSGPNAARASAAFQQSGRRAIGAGETVLIHCNAHADGYWTDITRTYVLGECPAPLRRLQDAVAEARAAALAAIRPGVEACAVDRAARAVLARAGLGDAFRHPAGHGVGFAAIDHDALPRLHPASRDTLAAGMVFNVEPGLYFDGQCGLRDCNMVAVTPTGHAVLTPFQLGPGDWRMPLPASPHPSPGEQP